MIETPPYGLTIFKVHFGALTLKGYSKGEHVLRFEAVCHNTKALHVGRVLDRFPDIVARLAGMVDRFCTTLDCVDVAFIPDGILDQLPQPSTIGRTRVGGIDLDQQRTRTTLAAVTALAASPQGFTVADLTNKVHTMTGSDGYTIRQAAYDLRKLRGHHLVAKPGPRPPLPGPTPRRPHHHRPDRAPPRGHRPHPRRGPRPPPRSTTHPLDHRRPRLRGPPRRHAQALQRPRPHQDSRIDNDLSIRNPKPLAGRPPTKATVAVIPDSVAVRPRFVAEGQRVHTRRCRQFCYGEWHPDRHCRKEREDRRPARRAQPGVLPSLW